MKWTATGANIGSMLTGLSAITATFLWGRARISDWKLGRSERMARNWNGYIMREAVATWYVRVLDFDKSDARSCVTLDIVDQNGNPDVLSALSFVQFAKGDGLLSRSPSIEQWQFLEDLRRSRHGAAGGYPIL